MSKAYILSRGTAQSRGRPFSTFRALQHENPLGLPRSGAPPQFIRRKGLPEKRNVRDVRKVIAVSSAKGGVGKSTIAVNLALAFARQGHRSGILDTDIFGPSIPRLLNLSGEPNLTENNQLIPLSNYGVKSMSMGYLIPKGKPVVWRGLMVTRGIQQLLHEVSWGGLDILVLDLPPGTGDTQLTIAQQINLSGAVIVSTPEEIAIDDTINGLSMFQTVSVPILGMIQNKSVYVCPKCGNVDHIYDSEGVSRVCESQGVDLLGDVPVDTRIRIDAGRGKPTVVAEPESGRARTFMEIAERIAFKVEL